LRPPVRRSTHGALLQEDADEVADVCAVKIALERSIPLESVAFKNEGALHDILPGLEVRRWHGDEHGREAWRWLMILTTAPALESHQHPLRR